MITKTYLNVRLDETDLMGIVHHSNYPIWFETGRSDYLKKAGIPNYKIHALGFFLPLSELKCEYKSPARYGDRIIVVTSIKYMSCVKIKFQYKVLMEESGKLLTSGTTVHAWTNRNIEPVNIKKAAPEICSLLKPLIEPDNI